MPATDAVYEEEVSGLTHKKERQGTVINGLDCAFLQLVVVTSEELEYVKMRTHKVGARGRLRP
jgi:hypothetical protein